LIIFVHLLNDFSGSPRVLKAAISAVAENEEVQVWHGDNGPGVLDNLDLSKRRFFYRRFDNKILTLSSYILSQLILFCKLVLNKDRHHIDTVVVNTVLPFAAGLYGYFLGKRVVWYLHEISVKPRALEILLKFFIRMCATEIIYVSQTHRDLFPVKGVPSKVIYNSVDLHVGSDTDIAPLYRDRKMVLMAASLRKYKGIHTFRELAESLPQYDFVLIANDDEASVDLFRKEKEVKNLSIIDRTSDMAGYYRSADMVVNLSNPDQWVETFGLTIIEGMASGAVALAPPVGGPAEIITDMVDGVLVDPRDFPKLKSKVVEVLDDEVLFQRLVGRGHERASFFSSLRYKKEIVAMVLGKVT
jgi:glycosyltransferase involved in cell wall biosynthesis